MPENEKATLLRSIPSVDELLRTQEGRKIADAAGQMRALRFARETCEALRRSIIEGGSADGRAVLDEAVSRMTELWRADEASRVRRVINATGVVVHTNLGRSRLSDTALEAIGEAAGYCTLEYDLESGKRGRRGAAAERMICDLTGAEAAVIVNNCAAAAFLVLTVFARGREVIVSRGELVEIGGDFRVPDVMAQSGAAMREVGTTNRTKMRDYETAIGPETAMILRVHPSNYRIVGFTETPSIGELAGIAHRAGIVLFEDAGSGALTDLSPFGLGDEPLISRSIAEGADIVSFSGDKLLGGPQAGIVAGKRELIDQIRRHPLYRALRVDKLVYAALEATLGSYLKGKQFEEVPTQRMIAATEEKIRKRSEAVAAAVRAGTNGRVSVDIVEGESVIGGGAAPGVKPATALIAIEVNGARPDEIEARLRENDPPVIARIEADRVVVDLRTVAAEEETELIAALAAL